jgi:hypothetical protein
MTRVLTVLAVLALTVTSAAAGTTCRQNWDGSVRCSNDGGGGTTCRRNWDGSIRCSDY